MMGKNNPMAIINFSDKLEFQGRGAAHIHGAAWCDIRKISQSINLTVPRSESDEEIESNSDLLLRYLEIVKMCSRSVMHGHSFFGSSKAAL